MRQRTHDRLLRPACWYLRMLVLSLCLVRLCTRSLSFPLSHALALLPSLLRSFPPFLVLSFSFTQAHSTRQIVYLKTLSCTHTTGKTGGGQITVEQVRQARDMWISSVQRLSVAETVALYDTQNVRLLGTVDTEGACVFVSERERGWPRIIQFPVRH